MLLAIAESGSDREEGGHRSTADGQCHGVPIPAASPPIARAVLLDSFSWLLAASLVLPASPTDRSMNTFCCVPGSGRIGEAFARR